ncbi:hypothetical protein [unidentified bacterial endosymbiont]|uniref:hypothetical protein n=1 Tax=unidentified bacterial endosymbiont TaxID=2355 RepID=UPI00209D90DD|nr:hypothetical protein [unidentified bacterial endosymbiont]
MTKVTSYPNTVRTHAEVKLNGVKTKKKTINTTLTKMLKSVVNSSAKLKMIIFKRSSQKNNSGYFNSSHDNLRKTVIDSKVTRELISQKLKELDLTGKAKKDPVFARQSIDAVLASVYSNKKDFVCRDMMSNDKDISGYLKEIGHAAQQAGLEGKVDNNNTFIPAGAGANPFVTPVISNVQHKIPHVFFNKKQQVYFKQYVEKKISHEVGEICKEKGRISPDEFATQLDKIASRYLSGQEYQMPAL